MDCTDVVQILCSEDSPVAVVAVVGFRTSSAGSNVMIGETDLASSDIVTVETVSAGSGVVVVADDSTDSGLTDRDITVMEDGVRGNEERLFLIH